jgi:phosphoribosyl 1,2-cyclic phosphate phosphodiesterase
MPIRSLAGNMRIIILGTGTSQGVPVIGCTCEVCTSSDPRDNRLRTSAFIETKEANLLIDCGPDFRQQMLREGIDRVDGVLITHAHQDHIAGLDDLRSFIFRQNKPMPIYAEENVVHTIKQRFAYAFSENPYPGAPTFAMHTIQPGTLHIEGVEIEAIRVQHGKLAIVGFRVGHFAYLTDVNHIDHEAESHLQNLDVLVLDALHHRPHHSHFNVHQALDEIARLQPEKAYLTHISHHMGLHGEMEEQLPENVHLGYDGLRFTF